MINAANIVLVLVYLLPFELILKTSLNFNLIINRTYLKQLKVFLYY